MWANYVVTCFFAVILLYLPGCLVFGDLIAKRRTLIAWAPFVSLFLVASIGFLAYRLNLVMTGWLVLCVTGLIAALIGAVRHLICRRKRSLFSEGALIPPLAGETFPMMLLYLCISVAVSVYAFVSVIGSPDWFPVEIDNAYHLNELYAMASTGQFSATSISTFPTIEGYGSMEDASFYPALWHVIAAVLLDSVAGSAPLAENAANFVFVAVAFPLGVWSFLVAALKTNKKAILAGSLTCICFFDFPWHLLTYGLLCSNFAAFAMVPAALSVFVFLVDAKSKRVSQRVMLFLILLMAIACLALLQPNAIFASIVLVAFYCIWRIMYGGLVFGFPVGEKNRKWLAAAFVGVCVAVWVVAYNASFMQEVLSVSWSHISSKTQGVFNILFLSYCNGPANLVMGFLVLVGAVAALKDKKTRWIVCSYCLCAMIHYSTASTESIFKHWLSGFWYTDPRRTAALCVLGAIPLSAIGLASIVNLCEKVIRLLRGGDVLPLVSSRASRAVFLVAAALLLAPNYTIPGLGSVSTAFGDTRAMVKAEYDMSDKVTLSSEEVAFVREAKQIVGDDLVLNSPYDGTAFLYGVTGVQFYYRSLLSSPEKDPNEPPESRILRHSLDTYAYDEEVGSALEITNAKYVLLLDSLQYDERIHVFTYNPEDWSGINSVKESTEGFELVLEKDDMRLYKITAV